MLKKILVNVSGILALAAITRASCFTRSKHGHSSIRIRPIRQLSRQISSYTALNLPCGRSGSYTALNLPRGMSSTGALNLPCQARGRSSTLPSVSVPWVQPATALKRSGRSTARDLTDASWVPYTNGVFAGKDIFIFNDSLTMHNTLDCVPDTAIRALMMKDRKWSYNTSNSLKTLTRKLREVANCPREGMIQPNHAGIKKLFFSYKIGIILVKSTGLERNDPKIQVC